MPFHSSIFGTGGGGGSSRDLRNFLAFIREEQTRIRELDKSEKHKATVALDFRRNELQDRGGFGGTVLFGAQAGLNDETLRKQIDRLGADDPQRGVFNLAVSEEKREKDKDKRLLSGETDAFREKGGEVLARVKSLLEDVKLKNFSKRFDIAKREFDEFFEENKNKFADDPLFKEFDAAFKARAKHTADRKKRRQDAESPVNDFGEGGI